MIRKYSNETQTLWNRGQFKVQLMVPSSNLPIGFCDGSAEDITELEGIAEAEVRGDPAEVIAELFAQVLLDQRLAARAEREVVLAHAPDLVGAW